jgi:hypothetical protein
VVVVFEEEELAEDIGDELVVGVRRQVPDGADQAVHRVGGVGIGVGAHAFGPVTVGGFGGGRGVAGGTGKQSQKRLCVCPENVGRFGSQLGRSALTNRTDGSGKVSVSSVTIVLLLTLSYFTMVWRPMRVGLVSWRAGEWTACLGDYIMCPRVSMAPELTPEAERRGQGRHVDERGCSEGSVVGPESPRKQLLSGAKFAVRDLSLFAGDDWARVVAESPLVTRPNPPRQSAAIRTRNGLGRAIWQVPQAHLALA